MWGRSQRPIAHEGRVSGIHHGWLERLSGTIVNRVFVEPKCGEDGFATITLRLPTRLPAWCVRRFWRPEFFTVDAAPWGHYATVRFLGMPAYAVASPLEACLDEELDDDADDGRRVTKFVGRAAGDIRVTEAFVDACDRIGAIASITLRQDVAEIGKMDAGADASVVWEHFALFGLCVSNPANASVDVVATKLRNARGDALYAVSVNGAGERPVTPNRSRTATVLLRRPSNHGLDETKFMRDDAFTPYALLDYDGALGEWMLNLRDRWIPRPRPAPTAASNPEENP